MPDLAPYTVLGTLYEQAQARNVGFYHSGDGQGRANQGTAIGLSGHTAVQMFDLSPAELATVDVLWVVNENNGGFGAEWVAAMADITSAVTNDGLVYVVHDRTAGPTSNAVVAGGGLDINRNDVNDLDVLDNSTSLTNGAGPGGPIDNTTLNGGQSAAHGFVAAPLPVGAFTPFNVDGDTSLVSDVVYPLGNGVMWYSAIPLDCYLGGGENCDGIDPFQTNAATILAPNMIDYAAQLAN